MSPSPWAFRQFGAVAPELLRIVPPAIATAHALAVAAQAAAKTTKKDTYGHTLKNTQHEQLVLAAGTLSGIEVFNPRGTSFEMVRVLATGTLLYPWRYATNASQAREQALMAASGFRSALLHGDVVGDRQLVLDEHADLEPEGLAAQLAEEADVLDQLNALAPVVIIGFASDVKTLIHLGWGDAVHTDARGHLHWQHWEDLALPGAVAHADFPSTSLRAVPTTPSSPALSPAARSDDPHSAARRRAPRFDDLPVPSLNITARPVPQDQPTSEAAPGAPRQGTGTEAADSGSPQDERP